MIKLQCFNLLNDDTTESWINPDYLEILQQIQLTPGDTVVTKIFSGVRGPHNIAAYQETKEPLKDVADRLGVGPPDWVEVATDIERGELTLISRRKAVAITPVRRFPPLDSDPDQCQLTMESGQTRTFEMAADELARILGNPVEGREAPQEASKEESVLLGHSWSTNEARGRVRVLEGSYGPIIEVDGREVASIDLFPPAAEDHPAQILIWDEIGSGEVIAKAILAERTVVTINQKALKRVGPSQLAGIYPIRHGDAMYAVPQAGEPDPEQPG